MHLVTHVVSVPAEDRCNVSDEEYLKSWFKEHKTEDVEAFGPERAGVAWG